VAVATFLENAPMLRTIFAVGVMAILGIVALKLVFGVMGAFVGLLFMLLLVAVKIALVGGVIYLGIRVLSPDTARKIREKTTGA
jgi:hypothetical protein